MVKVGTTALRLQLSASALLHVQTDPVSCWKLYMCLSQYGLRAGWYGDRLPAGTRDFSLVSNVQTASRSQRIPDFLPLGKGDRDVMLAIHLHVGLMIRVNTAIALSPYMS